MLLSIIIVNFNTESFLESCLKSLYKHNKSELQNKIYEVIVVDNASKINPEKELKKNFPDVIFIKNERNVGFAKANNEGIKETRGKYILLLNPDTEISSDTLEVMLEFMEQNPLCGVSTCKVILPSGQIDDASHRGFPTPPRALTHFLGLSKFFPHSTVFNGYHLGYKNMDKVHEIDACVGAFMLIKKEIGEELKWLDEKYFWYGEDLDFCYRVKEKGYKVMYVPTTHILHYKGIASGIKKHSQHLSKADDDTKKLATKARFEVMRTFYMKHYQDKYPSWLTYLVFLGINIKQKLAEIHL